MIFILLWYTSLNLLLRFYCVKCPPHSFAPPLNFSYIGASIWHSFFFYLFMFSAVSVDILHSLHFYLLLLMCPGRYILNSPLWYDGIPTRDVIDLIYRPVQPISGGVPWGYNKAEVCLPFPPLTLSCFNIHVHQYLHILFISIGWWFHCWDMGVYCIIYQCHCIIW